MKRTIHPCRRMTAMLCIVAGFLPAGAAFAGITGDLSPSSVNDSLTVGETKVYTFSYSMVVTGGGTSGKADVLLLTDSTGSMGGYIGGIKTAFSGIVTAVGAALPGMDIQYAVADYRNYTDGGNYTLYGVNLRQPFSSSQAVVQAAINTIYASGGGDGPESQFKAMVNVAGNWTTTGGALGFGGRADAQKLIIWAGDWLGHVAGDEGSASGGPPAGYYPTLDATVAALNARGIKVFGLNTVSASTSWGLNGNYGGHPQQDFVTSSTGGGAFYNVGTGGPTISQAIINSIIPGVETLTNITMNIVGSTGAFTVGPVSQTRTGSWTSGDSPVTGTFDLTVVAPGIVASTDFDVVLLGNGAQVSSAHVHLSTGPLLLTLYGRNPYPIYLSKPYTVYVWVLGSASVDVATLNSASVKFGRLGTEASPVRLPSFADVNRDGYVDALYGFLTPPCGFQLGDTVGILTGVTTGGRAAMGTLPVVVYP